MKRFIPILAVIVLIVALVFVNKGISRTARPDDDDDDSSQSSSQTKPSTPAPGGPDAGDSLTPEAALGNPSEAQYKITVGWIYDESSQANPQALAAALKVIQDAVAHSGGKISAEIVDLDVPPSDLSPAASAVTNLGVMINGKSVGPVGNPGEGVLTAGFLAHSLPGH